MPLTLLPDLVLDSRGARSGVGVTLEAGRVIGIGAASEGERLRGAALAPGFVNAHSHAFQRALRGRVERVAPGHDRGDFWTWREQMYALAGSLEPDSMREIAERCYREMLSVGYTSVAEFHYVHHRPDGDLYDDPNAMARAVIEAAEAAGVRLLLLPTAYARGGLARFRDRSPEAFLERVESLREQVRGCLLVSVGLALHSVRAVPSGWLRPIAEHARREHLPLHVHACEQTREAEECLAEHGIRPVELLAAHGALGSNTIVIHATHASERELDLIAEAGACVCACPTTEGNLGDGFLPAEGILARGIRLSIGSDSHVRLDPFEELREIETNARRLARRRNVLVAEGEQSPAPWLLRAGWQRDGIRPGEPADLVELDLSHPSLEGVPPEHLSEALVFGCGAGVVSAVWVSGRRYLVSD